MKFLVAQSCPTLCDPMNCSPPGSSLHGIPHARILEWVAISFSRVLPNPGFEPGSPAFQEDFEVNREASYVFIIKTKHATVTVEKKLI